MSLSLGLQSEIQDRKTLSVSKVVVGGTTPTARCLSWRH